MRCVCSLSLLLALAASASQPASAQDKTIDFPCMKNLSDGRVLVDGTQWDQKMQDLGYHLEDGAYVPYKVESFTQRKAHDTIWADGMCRMKLLPVAK